MTKIEFLSAVPDIVTHKAWGYAELEILEDSRKQKWERYKHENKISSYGNHAPTWLELYKKLSTVLIGEGHLVNSNE